MALSRMIACMLFTLFTGWCHRNLMARLYISCFVASYSFAVPHLWFFGCEGTGERWRTMPGVTWARTLVLARCGNRHPCGSPPPPPPHSGTNRACLYLYFR